MRRLLQSTRSFSLLRSEIEKNRFSHAYLLQADDARNLRFFLKEMAKCFFLEEKNADEIARRIDEENFSDCQFFPEKDKAFTVKDAELLIEESMLNPVESNRKVCILCDFAQANAPSQNKLLKLLEEPPENVVFLLGTTSSYAVLPTVLSRVEKLEIPPFDENAVYECLRRIYKDGVYTPSQMQLCAAASGGCLGTAQNMLEDGEYNALMDDAFSLCLATGATLPPLIKRIGETKNKKQLLFLLRLLFRDAAVLLSQPNGKEYVFLRGEYERLQQMTEKYLLPSLLYAQEELTKAELHFAFNAVFPQCLEVTMSKILLQNAKNIRKMRKG